MSTIDSIALRISRKIMLDIKTDTIPVDVRKIGQLQAKIQCILEEYIREHQAALSQPNEPYKYELSYDNEYGRSHDYFDTDNKERAYLWAKEVYHNLNPKVVELFTAPPNTSELEQENKLLEVKCEELKDERDIIFGLLKQLRVTMFNMCNEDKSDLEWIYETNMLMKQIDFMFLHGYLQDGKTEIADLTAKVEKMREALIHTISLPVDGMYTFKVNKFYIEKTLEECK